MLRIDTPGSDAAMIPNPAFLLVFGILALTVLSLWAPPLSGKRGLGLGWGSGLVLACLAGLYAGYLDWRAPLWIAAYAALACWARQADRPWLRGPLLVLTGLSAFLFALHRFPGFFNPVLAEGIRFSRGAPPYTLHANFDTAAAGIVLMGVFCEPIRAGAHSAAEWGAMLRRVWPVTLSALVLVLGTGWALGYVKPDLKWTPYSALFLLVNLLFTCVTEEAFFRGFLLERLARALAGWRAGKAIAVVASSVLFGLAHARGGALLVLLATIAGLHYAAAYLVSRRIEGAILTHFALNAVHFLAFTYPALSA
jgi:membrane protease YdiL (CAAX protease family)